MKFYIIVYTVIGFVCWIWMIVSTLGKSRKELSRGELFWGGWVMVWLMLPVMLVAWPIAYYMVMSTKEQDNEKQI